MIAFDPASKLRPLGITVHSRHLCDLARFEPLFGQLPREVWPKNVGNAVAMKHFRVHILCLPEGPEMTPIAEVCESARRLFQVVREDLWTVVANMYVYQYQRRSGDYGADDGNPRPRVYDWRNLLPRGSIIPPPTSKCMAGRRNEQTGERGQHETQPADEEGARRGHAAEGRIRQLGRYEQASHAEGQGVHRGMGIYPTLVRGK